MPVQETTSEFGILGVRDVDFGLERFPPAPDLAALVERHWLVTWALPEGREASVTLLPHPCVNLVLDGDRLAVAGVGRERFTYVYRGVGRVFGVKFRPGAFLPFLGAPVSTITDVTMPAERVWGPAVGGLAREMAALPHVEQLIAAAEGFLRARWPAEDPQVELVGRIVTTLLHDREIARVEDVARRFGLRLRTLQRLFARYVGVSPKWVLRRYRLHEAAAALAREQDRPWAEVAAELGYFDQSHFIRDFTAAIGLTPVAYAQACAAQAGACAGVAVRPRRACGGSGRAGDARPTTRGRKRVASGGAVAAPAARRVRRTPTRRGRGLRRQRGSTCELLSSVSTSSRLRPGARSRSSPDNRVMPHLIAPGDAAHRTGLSLDTLRYYEREGIIGPIRRDTGGRRRYTEDDVAWIGIVTCLRDAGLGIDDLRRFTALLAAENGHADRVAFLRRIREELQERLRSTRAALSVLDDKIDYYGR